MSPPRFRSPVALAGERIDLGPAAAKHARVLRLTPGDVVHVADDDAHECEATIVSLDAASLVVALGEIRTRNVDAHAPVLVQCVPKANKLDDIVRAATEAGVAEIHLALAARSVARAAGKLDRLERIAVEAARQCEAPRPPRIIAPAPLTDVCARAPIGSARVVLSPREGVPFVDAVRAGSPAWLVVGPEGGLADDEHDALTRLGYALARLDTYVLRTEHAGPIAVALARELHPKT
jgi:16S rRNA (uracil1498-N3)-methyltransferase